MGLVCIYRNSHLVLFIKLCLFWIYMKYCLLIHQCYHKRHLLTLQTVVTSILLSFWRRPFLVRLSLINRKMLLIFGHQLKIWCLIKMFIWQFLWNIYNISIYSSVYFTSTINGRKSPQQHDTNDSSKAWSVWTESWHQNCRKARRRHYNGTSP